jgi:hypothetical protein
MKITRVSGVVYRQELKLNGPRPKFAGEGRDGFETLLVKVEADAGVIGSGDAYGYAQEPRRFDSNLFRIFGR